MSGIAAVFRTDGGPVDPGTVAAMTAAMAYRGPDGIGHFCDGPVGLGHCLLDTAGVPGAGVQPLASDDGQTVVCFDGYLSNPDELRGDLAACGVRLRDRSDAELVLHAYRTWGESCPARIDGEFAFAIWDAHRQELFCAKDHQGLCPLYYHWDGTTLVVASEIAAVLTALPEEPPLDIDFLTDILGNVWTSGEATVWHGVRRARAAHSLRIGRGASAPRQQQYWHLPTEVAIRYRRDEDYAEHYHALLTDCVRRSARSHLPVAFEVSGGLDSTSLFCVASALVRQGQLHAPGIKGYTLAGQPGTAADEVRYARLAAAHAGEPLQEVPLFLPGLDWYANRSAEDRDMATYTNGSMMIGIHQALVADGCKMAIEGDGGDSWLSGSRLHYHEDLASLQLGALLRSLRADTRDIGSLQAWRRMVRSSLGPWLPAPLRERLRRRRQEPPEAMWWLRDSAARSLAARRRAALGALPHHLLERSKLHRFTVPFRFVGQDLMSRQRAQYGCEYRRPMLSRAFLTFSATTPEHIKLRGRMNKFVHREALRGVLPEEVRMRSDKAEFSASQDHLAAALQRLFTSSPPDGLLALADPEGIRRMANDYCAAPIDSDYSYEIWGNYVVWCLLINHRKAI